MKKILTISIAILLLSGCRGQEKNNVNNKSNDQAYLLMKQYCYICHMAGSRDDMIAPPLFRVKEHYLPVYKTEKEFVEAIVKWAKNPSEDIALMPGALRKFEKMPAQYHIPEDTIRLIAKYIYNNDMERPHWFQKNHGNHRNRKMMMDGGKIQLEDGKKIDVSGKVVDIMKDVKNTLNNFSGKSVNDYNNLGKTVFDKAKIILLDKSNKGETWDKLHTFFNSMEETMHSLIGTKSLDEAKKLKNKLNNQVNKFFDYFE